MTIHITRLEFTAAELRRKACQVSDPDQARRLLAIASIRDGASRSEAAKSAGMDRQTLRDWVYRYNAEGAEEGLKDRPHPGRKPLLGDEQLVQLVETKPDPVKDGVVRWRCADLKAQIKRRFGVEISERSVSNCRACPTVPTAPTACGTKTRSGCSITWAKRISRKRSASRLIPAAKNHDSFAQLRCVTEATQSGVAMNAFQASQQASTMSP